MNVVVDHTRNDGYKIIKHFHSFPVCLIVEVTSYVLVGRDPDGLTSSGEDVKGFGMSQTSTNKIHQCSYCGYSTPKYAHYAVHLRTHTGEKPYVCPCCPFRCTQSGNLKIHLRTHTGEKPYSCHYCPFRCTQKSNLKIHLRTHNGEKPNSCDYGLFRCDSIDVCIGKFIKHLKMSLKFLYS
nr:zinc finger protein Pegasus-like [Penaeus vannamei]